MRTILIIALAGGVLVCSARLVHRAGKTSSAYAIQDLGTLGGQTSIASALNNRGEVVGQADNALSASRAFLWSHGRMRDLGGLPDRFTGQPNASAETTAASLNDLGDIVGDSDTGFGTVDGSPRGIFHAVLWHNGRITDLGTLGGYPDSTAVRISAAGLVLGRAIQQEKGPRTDRYKDCAFLVQSNWRRPCLGGISVLNITSQGQVAGWRRPGGQTEVVVSDGQHIRTLGLVQPGYIAENMVISSSGKAAMTWGKWDGENDPSSYGLFPSQAVFWQGGRWQKLTGLPALPITAANGISKAGTIVGMARTALTSAASQETTAVAWQNGKIKDLNQLIPSGLGWKLKNATGINEHGQIIGFGHINGQDHAFLLTPTAK